MAVVGVGHLGDALIRRLLDAGYPAHRLHAVTRSPESARQVQRELGVDATHGENPAPLPADVVLLAVPPSAAAVALARAVRRGAGIRSVVSFVAGRSIAQCQADVGSGAASPTVHRAAANVMAVRRGGLLAVSSSSPLDAAPSAMSVLSRIGRTVEIVEDQQDAAACTLGSGAAFLALAVETLVAASGLEETIGREFALEAAIGAGEIVRQRLASHEHRWGGLVTEGGLTAAGLDVLERRAVADAYRAAVETAVARAQGLLASQ